MQMKNFMGVSLVEKGWHSVRAQFLKLPYQNASICIGIIIQQHKLSNILKSPSVQKCLHDPVVNFQVSICKDHNNAMSGKQSMTTYLHVFVKRNTWNVFLILSHEPSPDVCSLNSSNQHDVGLLLSKQPLIFHELVGGSLSEASTAVRFGWNFLVSATVI